MKVRLHAFELGLEPFLGRVDEQLRSLAEEDLLDFDEAEESPLRNTGGVDLIDLAGADEVDAVDGLRRSSEEATTMSRSLSGVDPDSRLEPPAGTPGTGL